MEENNSQRKRYDSSERRKTPRLERKLIVQYRIKELSRSGREQASVEPSVDITQTKDLSEGGIFFTADKIIPPQTVLDLKLRLPTQKEAFNLEGRVVGCDEIEKNIHGLCHFAVGNTQSFRLELKPSKPGQLDREAISSFNTPEIAKDLKILFDRQFQSCEQLFS